jgi:hypothetical protein
MGITIDNQGAEKAVDLCVKKSAMPGMPPGLAGRGQARRPARGQEQRANTSASTRTPIAQTFAGDRLPAPGAHGAASAAKPNI